MGLRNFRMYPYAGDIWWQCLQYCHYRPPYSVWNLWKLYTCKYRGHYLCKSLGQGFCYMPSTFINMMGMEHYFILWVIFEIDLLQSLFVVYLAGLIFYSYLYFLMLYRKQGLHTSKGQLLRWDQHGTLQIQYSVKIHYKNKFIFFMAIKYLSFSHMLSLYFYHIDKTKYSDFWSV